MGNIIESARKYGIKAFGSDLIAREGFTENICDFLNDSPPILFNDIVCNPPFSIAESFVLRALELAPIGGKIAMILPLVWMAGFSSKRDWLPRSPLRTVFPISPRPSMPPGAVIMAGIRPGNGTKDYAWFVWQRGYEGSATISFLNTNLVLHSRRRRGRIESESAEQWDLAY